MEKMKRVLALLLVFAMLMPNMTTIALAADTEEESVEISTEPVVVMEEEPEETEATEAVAETSTEPAAEQTETPVQETEPPVTEAEYVEEETQAPVQETESSEEKTEAAVLQKTGTVEETGAVSAANEAVAETLSAELTMEQTDVSVSEYSNDDMFAIYLDRLMYPNKPSTLGTSGYDSLPDSTHQNLYFYLKDQMCSVANEGGSSVFTVHKEDLAELGVKTYITAADMGIQGRTDVTEEELQALVDEQLALDIGVVIDALLTDCPYELYWYDKTIGWTMNYYDTYSYYDTGEITKVVVNYMVFRFTVAKDYRGDSNYTVDATSARAATETVDKAMAVVNANEKKSDHEKLIAYKDYICSQVIYNNAAIDNDYTGGYGDPWQIIYVFDEDPTTDVVCEGYAKAFQYLCDLSHFQGDTECFLIFGYADGLHMWNIVSIDGRNYMVDITNTDECAIENYIQFGEDGTVFLAGTEGSIVDGYTFTNSLEYTLTYSYFYTDNGEICQDAIDIYGDDEDSILNLSDISYAEYLEQQEQEEQPEQPEEIVEQDPYISLRWLDYGNGWFENHENEMHQEIRIVPGEQFYMIAYLNQWDVNAQDWNVTPIHASKLVVDENLILEPFRNITDGSNHTEENQNFDCFFRVCAAEGVTDVESHIAYSNTDIRLPVTIGRHPGGFYRENPIGGDTNSLWLNEFLVNGSNRTFWFWYDASKDYEEGWTVGEVTVSADREIGGEVQVQKFAENLYTITVSTEAAKNIYSLRDFWIHVNYTLVQEGKDPRNEGADINCCAPEFGEPNASFEINGQQYHASWNYDGLFTFKSEDGEEYPVPAEIEGVSYDIHSNTLTLNGAHLETLRVDHHWYDEHSGEEGWNLPDSRFNIELVDSNSITANNDHAIVISNDVHLTILGDGSLTVSAHGDENNNCHSAFEVNESDVTIAGNAKVTVSISGENNYEQDGVMHRGNMNAIWGYGNGRWLHLRDNATLTTQVPEGICINGYFDQDGRFVEEGSYSGIVFFNIEVNDNATLNTQTIRVWDEGRGNAYGAYYQNGGTVNISGIPYYNYFEEADENGNHEHYHFNGIEASYGQIDINGGVLNISMTATEAQLAKSTYYHGIQSRGRHIGLNGGVINVSGNFSGTGIKVGEDNWDGGTNAWADFNNSTLNMGGSDLYRCAIDVATNGSINFNGGVINAKPADIQIRGDAQWNGTQAYLEGCGIHIQGNAQLNDGFISVKDGFFRVHQGGSLTKNACYVELDNSFVTVFGEMNLESGAFLQSLNFDELNTDAEFAQAFVIDESGLVEISKEAYLEVKGTGKVDGICNNGTFHQNGGSVVVEVDANETTAALFGHGENRFDNGFVQLNGYNGLVQFNKNEKSGLYVGGGTTLNADGRTLGIAIYAPAVFDGGYVNAYAKEAAGNESGPIAVLVQNDEGGTNARLTINGGSHYFAVFDGETLAENGVGFRVVNAPVALNGGALDVEAAVAVIVVGDDRVHVSEFISNETGASLQLTDNVALNAKTLMVGENYARSVAFRTSRNCGENVTWKLEDGVLTISGTGAMEDYHMPIHDPDSWRVAPWYVLRDSITKVVVEEGVTDIGYWAFGRLPHVKEIVYPSTVKTIRLESNYDCPELEKFTVAADNQVYSVTDEGKVLVENGSLVRTAVKGITSYTAGDDITTIGMGAFDSSDLEVLDLNKVQVIQNYAFADCHNLKEVVIPHGVETIEMTVFQNSGVESITIPASIVKIRNYAFDGCSELADVYFTGTESQWNAIAIGSGNNALTSLPVTFLETSEEVAGEPYLSYRMLTFGEHGYFEELGEPKTEMTIPVGYYPAMVVYCNYWNDEAKTWERFAVDPEQLYAVSEDGSKVEDLQIGPFRYYEGIGIEEGEPNGYNFFEMAFHSGWGSYRDLCMDAGQNKVAKLRVNLSRSQVGFYSEDPTIHPEKRDENWLNYYPINPNVSGHTVYFALTEHPSDFEYVRVDSDRLTPEDLALVRVEMVEGKPSIYRITLPDEVAAKVYDYRGIPLKVHYKIKAYEDLPEEEGTVEFTFGSVSFAGDCVTIAINGVYYEYYPGLEGYFSWDEENQKRLCYQELPGGITYDYENDVLTMNNSTIESLQVYWHGQDAYSGEEYYGVKDDDLTLKLIGANKIINPNSNAALAVGDGLTLTITGDANSSLLIESSNENTTADNYAQNAVNIYNGADLIIAGDTSVTTSVFAGGKKLNDACLMNIWAGGNNSITIKNNASLSTTIPEGARDNGDAYVNGYEGIGWFGELRVQDNATLNTSTLGLGEYYDEHNEYHGKGRFVQTGGTVTIEAYGFTNEEGGSGYQGFVINGGTEAKISGGKMIIKANTNNVAADKLNDTYDGFSGIVDKGHLEISGEDTLVEIQIPNDGTAVEVSHTAAYLRDGATLKVVGNGCDNYALNISEGGNFQLEGGKVDVTDAKVRVRSGANLEIHDGTLSVLADEHPHQTYLETNEHSEFSLHNGTVIVANGITEETPDAVSVGGRMHLNGGTMTVSGANAISVRDGAELNQNGSKLKATGYVKVLAVDENGAIYLNGGVTEAVLGESAIGNEGGDIDIGGVPYSLLRTVSNTVINNWSAAVNVYDGGMLEVNDGHHTFRVAGTPGAGYSLKALDVNGSVNFNGGTVLLDGGSSGDSIFNRTFAENSTVSFSEDMGAVSAENGTRLEMYHRGNDPEKGENYFSLGTEENHVSAAKITRISAGHSSSWRIEKNEQGDTILIISGKHDMYNYYMPKGEAKENWEKTPWFDYNDQITHVIVEEGISHIGDWVFARMTNLVNVKLPGSVNHISTSAFYGCSKLESFDMPGNDTYRLADGTNNVIIEGGWKVLLAAPSVTTFTVPADISEIGNGAFLDCTKLTSITFATNDDGWSNVWNIGNNAFQNTGLTEINLPQGVKAIGRNAFADCEALTKISLSDTVNTIRPYAFSGCGSQNTMVTYAGNESQWAQIAIGTGNNILDRVICQSGSAEIGDAYLSFRWLNMGENGWEENEHPADRNVYAYAGMNLFGVFYYNNWDEVNDKWETTPVIPAAAADAGITVQQIDEQMLADFQWKIADGESNSAYFVRIAVDQDAWDDNGTYGIVTYENAELDIQIHRNYYGFYSGTTASNETWLNDYELNPLKPYNNEFYFIFENSEGRTMDDNSFRIWNHNGIPDSYIKKYNVSPGIFRIVLDPIFLQDAWAYGDGFHLYAGFHVNDTGDGYYEETNFQLKAMDLSKADAIITVNDMEYLHFAGSNGWMSYGDPANDWRPGVANMPAGVSYSYDETTGNQILTLNNAKLNNLSLRYRIHDENGMPLEEFHLPNANLTINLVGSSLIESGHTSALNISGGLNVTIQGSGNLRLHSHNDPETRDEHGNRYAFDTVVVENSSTLNVAGGNVTAEISGEGYWHEGNPAMPAALRGREGSELMVSGGSLTTVVPENARDNAPEEVDFEHYYSTHAISEFANITVSGGTLTTTSLYVNNGETYEQSGGTVNITGLGHITWQRNEHGDQYQNYHYNGLQVHQGASAKISGGQLNLTVTPKDWEHGSNSYYSGLSISGGTAEISGDAKIHVIGAFDGDAINVGYDRDENGHPGAKGTLNMTGGTLTVSNTRPGSMMYGMDVAEGCTANISGGTLNMIPAQSLGGISNRGNLTIGGNAAVKLNEAVWSNGNLTVTGNAAMDVIHAEGADMYAWDIVPGSAFNFESGTITAEHAVFWIGGEMNIGENAKLNLTDSDFNADGEITLNGSLTMNQKNLVDNLFLHEASDEWGNKWDEYKYQSRLYVTGVLNLDGGELKLTNVPMNIEGSAVVNQNGTAVTLVNQAVPASQRKTSGNEGNDWIDSVYVMEDATLNINGGSFDLDSTDFDGGINMRGTMNVRNGTMTIDVPGGIAFAARGQTNVSGGEMKLTGNLGFEQAWEAGFDHGKLTVTGGKMEIDAVSGGIDACNNVVVTGGQIDIAVSGRVDDDANRDGIPVHGLYGTGIVAYNNDGKSVSVSINGGTVNIRMPENPQGYEEIQIFALAGFDNGTIRVNGGNVHTQGKAALYAESRTEGQHIRINNRLYVLSMETGNTLNMTSGIVNPSVDGHTYTWYIDTYEEDEVFTTPEHNPTLEGYATDLRFVNKTAGTNAFWDMENGVLTISAPSGKIGTMVSSADWSYVADKVTSLVLESNVEQPADLSKDLFPNLQSVKTPCNTPAANFTGVEVELIHDMVDGKCQKCEFAEVSDEPMAKLEALAVSAEGEVQLIMRMTFTDEILHDEGATVIVTEAANRITQVDQITTYTMSEIQDLGSDSKGRYALKTGIASGEMTGKVTVQLKDGKGNLVKIADYKSDKVDTQVSRTVVDYVRLALASNDVRLKSLMTAMITYGGYAQSYYQIDATNPAYNVLVEYGVEIPDISVVTADSIGEELTTTGNSIGIKYKSQKLGLDSSIYMSSLFELENGANIEEYTFRLTYTEGNVEKTKVVTPVQDGTGYRILIEDIPAAYLDYLYKITAIKNATGEEYTVSCSVTAWIKRCLNASSQPEKLKNMARAMYMYNQAANTYFNK